MVPDSIRTPPPTAPKTQRHNPIFAVVTEQTDFPNKWTLLLTVCIYTRSDFEGEPHVQPLSAGDRFCFQLVEFLDLRALRGGSMCWVSEAWSKSRKRCWRRWTSPLISSFITFFRSFFFVFFGIPPQLKPGCRPSRKTISNPNKNHLQPSLFI